MSAPSFTEKEALDRIRKVIEAAQPTLRDQFASAALTGILANPGTTGDSVDLMGSIAQVCYQMADAMIARSNSVPG